MMYKKPLMEVIEFEGECVVCTSGSIVGKDTNVNNEGSSWTDGEIW